MAARLFKDSSLHATVSRRVVTTSVSVDALQYVSTRAIASSETARKRQMCQEEPINLVTARSAHKRRQTTTPATSYFKPNISFDVVFGDANNAINTVNRVMPMPVQVPNARMDKKLDVKRQTRQISNKKTQILQQLQNDSIDGSLEMPAKKKIKAATKKCAAINANEELNGKLAKSVALEPLILKNKIQARKAKAAKKNESKRKCERKNAISKDKTLLKLKNQNLNECFDIDNFSKTLPFLTIEQLHTLHNTFHVQDPKDILDLSLNQLKSLGINQFKDLQLVLGTSVNTEKVLQPITSVQTETISNEEQKNETPIAAAECAADFSLEIVDDEDQRLVIDERPTDAAQIIEVSSPKSVSKESTILRSTMTVEQIQDKIKKLENTILELQNSTVDPEDKSEQYMNIIKTISLLQSEYTEYNNLANQSGESICELNGITQQNDRKSDTVLFLDIDKMNAVDVIDDNLAKTCTSTIASPAQSDQDDKLQLKSNWNDYMPAAVEIDCHITYPAMPYFIYRIELPHIEVNKPKQLKALLTANNGDPRLYKYMEKRDAPVSPVPTNAELSLTTLPHSSTLNDPRRRCIDNPIQQSSVLQSHFYYQQHQTPNMIIYSCLQRSPWYQSLMSTMKIQINQSISVLVRELNNFQKLRLIDPTAVFDVFKIDCVGELLEILRNLGIFVDSNGMLIEGQKFFNNSFARPNNYVPPSSSMYSFMQVSVAPATSMPQAIQNHCQPQSYLQHQQLQQSYVPPIGTNNSSFASNYNNSSTMPEPRHSFNTQQFNNRFNKKPFHKQSKNFSNAAAVTAVTEVQSEEECWDAEETSVTTTKINNDNNNSETQLSSPTTTTDNNDYNSEPSDNKPNFRRYDRFKNNQDGNRNYNSPNRFGKAYNKRY